jgi:CcmD family protein
MGYLFAAFLILWAVTFAYIFTIGARQKRLQQELEALKQNESI